jgi:very-short-patch-repair endonuclease
MLTDKLTGKLAEQFAGSNLPISEKYFVEVSCACGATTKLSTRALTRKWGAKGYYLCKSCSVKSYISNPERLEKWQQSFAKTAATPEHKARCSANGRKVWANSITREKITEAVRADNIYNPKKATSRAIALKALQEKSWFRDHMARMRILAHRAIRVSVKDDIDKWQDLAKNFHFERPEVKEKHRQSSAIARSKQINQISSIQAMLYTFLDELGIEYIKESEQTRIGHYVFDCLVINGDKRILVECQGDYWHSLSKAEQNDRSKFTYINRYFPEYEIMYIWEHEFYCKDRVLDRLKLKLGLDIETKAFSFSDLTIREINSTETKTFLDLYHYLGKDRGGKAFGVFDGDLLVAAIVFSPPLRQNTAGQFNLIDGEVRELSRLCIHPSYHKKNFASWFIKRALKQIDCKLVVAYADTTVGHDGGIYKASNFKLHHTVPADYWYVDISGYVMHKRTLYGRAMKQKMTEAEFAEAKGYMKKYGGEKLCFTYSQR